MPTYEEKLPATISAKHTAIRFTPSGDEFSPFAGLLVIESKRDTAEYILTEFPTGWPGRGFRLEKLACAPGTDLEADGYDCFVPASGKGTCDCKGFSRHARCKHTAALEALIENRWL